MKLLTIDNYKQLQTWVNTYGWNEYNSNIITMLMWNDTYPIYFKIYTNFALVCFEYNNVKHWFMPYSKKEYLKEAIDTLLVYSKEHNIPQMIHGVTSEAKDFLSLHYDQKIYFEYHERAGDYIYDRKQQESLTGKKMQKRRNHFNAFLKEQEGRFTYKTISRDDFPNILSLLKKWQSTKEECDSIQDEENSIHFLLDHYEELNLTGICIYIDGVLEAFNIASYLNDTMLQIHIEKANREIRGLYVAVLKYLLGSVDDKILYVNREDDMGDEALRKAKNDMKPLYKLRKYLAVFDEVKIENPKEEDIDEMKELWSSRFEDENENTTNFFFTNIMKKEDAWIIRNSHQIMGMAFINRWQMLFDANIKEVSFIEGVCTHEDYEGCGIMKKLLNHILANKNEIFALQAYNWDLYAPFNFIKTHFLKETYVEEIIGEEITFSSLNPETMATIYNQFVQDKNGYRIHDTSYYKDFYLPYMEACGYTTLQYEDKGYVTFYESDATLHIPAIHAIDDTIAIKMLATLHKMYNMPMKVTSDINFTLVGKSLIKPALMMIMKDNIVNAYINECI